MKQNKANTTAAAGTATKEETLSDICRKALAQDTAGGILGSLLFGMIDSGLFALSDLPGAFHILADMGKDMDIGKKLSAYSKAYSRPTGKRALTDEEKEAMKAIRQRIATGNLPPEILAIINKK